MKTKITSLLLALFLLINPALGVSGPWDSGNSPSSSDSSVGTSYDEDTEVTSIPGEGGILVTGPANTTDDFDGNENYREIYGKPSGTEKPGIKKDVALGTDAMESDLKDLGSKSNVVSSFSDSSADKRVFDYNLYARNFVGGASYVDLSANVVGFWRFEDNKGDSNHVLDQTGVYNGTTSTTGSSTFLTAGLAGLGGNAFSLAGGSSHNVDFGAVSHPTGDFSVALWFNTTDTTNKIIGGSRIQAGTKVGWECGINASAGKLFCNVDVGASTGTVSSTVNINDGVDHLMVLIHDADVGQRLYIDNVLQATASATGDAGTGAANLYLNKTNNQPTLYATAKYDNLLYLNKAVTRAERIFLYNAGQGTNFLHGPSIPTGPAVIDPNDTTPDVSAGKFFITSANTGATAITDLDNPVVGSEVCLIGGSATNSSTIADSGNFALSTAWTASVDDTLCLYVQADNDYIEIERTDN